MGEKVKERKHSTFRRKEILGEKGTGNWRMLERAGGRRHPHRCRY